MALLRPSLPVAALAALACSVLAVIAVVAFGSEPAPAPNRAHPAARADPLGVLREWDERRASAWATGDPQALAALYSRGSEAGRRDATMLRAYLRRGLRVEGMARQVLSLRVVDRTDRRLSVVVVDRLASATAVGDDVRRRLPRGSPAAHALVFHRVDGRWVLGRARSVGSPARDRRGAPSGYDPEPAFNDPRRQWP